MSKINHRKRAKTVTPQPVEGSVLGFFPLKKERPRPQDLTEVPEAEEAEEAEDMGQGPC